MKRTILFLAVVLNVASAHCAQRVTMASAEVLHKNLGACVLEDFDDTTKLSTRLGSRIIGPVGVAMEINRAFRIYGPYLLKKYNLSLLLIAMEKKRGHIIELLFKNDPQSLQELAAAGVYEQPS